MTRTKLIIGNAARRVGGSFGFAALLLLLPGLAPEAAAAGPPAPTLVAPTGTVYSNGTTITPTYTWNVSTGATSYRLQLLLGSTVLRDTTYQASAVCSGSTCTTTPADTLSAGAYTWQLRAQNSAGNSSWSTAAFNAAPQTWNGLLQCPNNGGTFLSGDFNGDGFTDRMCILSRVANVSLATPTGFAPPTPWVYATLRAPMIADIDNDGKGDLVDFYDFLGEFTVYKSTGSGFGASTSWGTASGCRIDTPIAGTGDFNGDGRADVWCKGATATHVYVGLQNTGGTAFTITDWGSNGCDATGAMRPGVADFNGDGKEDWYCISDTSGQLRVRLSSGTGFLAATFTSFGPFCAIGSWTFADLNGDGRPDSYCPANGNVAFNTGRSFILKASTTVTGGGARDIFAADVDGDGAAEIVANLAGAPANDIRVSKWNGTTLTAWQTWKGAFCDDIGPDAIGHVTGGDFNGDGKLDLLCLPTQRVAVGGSKGTPTDPLIMPDLMIAAGNGLGGTTTVHYTASSAFPRGETGNNPPVRPVVTSLTISDGRGGSSTSTFSYAGSKIDRIEREFLGFQTMRAIAPCVTGESLCPYSDSTFSQELASIGAPIQVDGKDGSGNIFSRTASTYTNTTTLPRVSHLTRVDNTIYDGSNSKSTNTTYAYDAYGNQTQQVFSGDASATGDELETDTTYVPNSTAFIVSRPAKIEQRVPAGSALTSQELLYDNAPTYNQAPTVGNLTKVRNLLNPGGTYVARIFAYDAYGNPTSATDETNRTTITTYDTTDNLFPTSTQSPASETTTMTWDRSCGAPTQTTDPNSQNTSSQYDALCRLTRTDAPLGAFQTISYVDIGNPTLQHNRVETNPPTGASGNLFTEHYMDGFGRTYRTRRRGPSTSQAIVTETTYNARGGVASATAPFYEGDAQQATHFEYDSLDRVTLTRQADSSTAGASYGLWEVTTTDENGKLSTTRYDAYGRMIEKERTLNGQPIPTHLAYDVLGRLVGLTDALGNAWSWTYDSLGRMLAKADPDAGNWTYQYDSAGRPTQQTDAKAQVTTLNYDSGGRLATKTNGVGTTAMTYSEARSGFYNVGRPTTVTSPGTISRTDYDAAGRPVKVTRTLGGVDYVAQKRYDAGGRVTGITYPDGDAVGTPASPLAYDEAGRLQAIPGIVTAAQYDAMGHTILRSNANGTQTTWTWSPERGFLQAIRTNGPATIQDLTYARDPAGLVDQVTSVFPNESWSYTYDDLYRMTQATNITDSAQTQSFTYDEIGRITYNSRVGTYAYPVAGQPRPHAPATVNGSPLSYDANGNLISGRGRNPVWDAENRIVQIGTTQFAYDAFGERLKKTGGSGTSLYPFGDDYEITNGVVTKYVRVAGLGTVAKRVGSTTYWLHSDQLGSIQAITDSAGSVVQRHTYRPFGESIGQSGPNVESRGWIEQRQDGETGLTYLHARYYDPALGTFLSPDPIGIEGGLNSYGYAFGNPVNLSDPSGLDADPCAGLAAPCYPANTATTDVGAVYMYMMTSMDLLSMYQSYFRFSNSYVSQTIRAMIDGMIAQAIMQIAAHQGQTAPAGTQQANSGSTGTETHTDPTTEPKTVPKTEPKTRRDDGHQPTDDVAFDALGAIHSKSRAARREYAGTIYRAPDGKYGRTEAWRGSESTSNPHFYTFNGDPSSPYYGTLGVAVFHSHGGVSPGFLDERFSTDDYTKAQGFSSYAGFNVLSYLVTPSESILRYDPSAGFAYEYNALEDTWTVR